MYNQEINQHQRMRINKEIIEKANSVKIDIPAITEELLINNNYNENYTKENVLQVYKEIFNKCKLLLQKYQISPYTQFEIGIKDNGKGEEGLKLDRIYYNDQGNFFSEYKDMGMRYYHLEEIICDLHPIQHILTKLYLTLIRLAEFNKEKIKQLEFE